jgi:WD40 repeat protein
MSVQLKVWRLATGVCLRKFAPAHPQGITSVQFTKDSTQVLTSSYDTTLRMHGLKSGKTLKEFRFVAQMHVTNIVITVHPYVCTEGTRATSTARCCSRTETVCCRAPPMAPSSCGTSRPLNACIHSGE